MKKSEIKLEKIYIDNKGNIRRIMDIGAHLAYAGQIDTDCVKYYILVRKSGLKIEGCWYICTRRAFAQWAKEEIPS